MNQVINIKSILVFILKAGFLAICLNGSIFLQREALYSNINFYGEPSELSLDEQSGFQQNLYAQSDGPILTNPDWVPPVNRNKYPGYQLMEDAKKNSEIWKYSTNRPGGKIKGGGTVKYRDYRSVTRQTRPDSGGGTGKPGK